MYINLQFYFFLQLYYMLYLSRNEPIRFKPIEQQRLFTNARHPLLIGPLIVLWFVPCMPADRLLVAILLPLYQIWGNRVTHEDAKYAKMQYQNQITELRTEIVFRWWYHPLHTLLGWKFMCVIYVCINFVRIFHCIAFHDHIKNFIVS